MENNYFYVTLRSKEIKKNKKLPDYKSKLRLMAKTFVEMHFCNKYMILFTLIDMGCYTYPICNQVS